jgi:hypothetical protein
LPETVYIHELIVTSTSVKVPFTEVRVLLYS